VIAAPRRVAFTVSSPPGNAIATAPLRGKLEAALPDRQFIHTHPGFGYRFQPQPSRNVHIDTGDR
jgi:hypothetical protein